MSGAGETPGGTPQTGGTPRTQAEKISYLLEHAIPSGEKRPSDRQIAHAINEKAGKQVISHVTLWQARTGVREIDSEDKLAALADYFDVSPLFFQPNDEVVNQVVEGLRFLASLRSGDITGVAARGARTHGVSADMLAYLNEIIDELTESGELTYRPDSDSSG